MLEVVIKITEETVNKIKDNAMFADSIPSEILWDVTNAITNGVLLPKGHGDLKDVSKIDYRQGVFLSSDGEPLPIIHKIATIEMIRDWLDTIIEADKEDENEWY